MIIFKYIIKDKLGNQTTRLSFDNDQQIDDIIYYFYGFLIALTLPQDSILSSMRQFVENHEKS